MRPDVLYEAYALPLPPRPLRAPGLAAVWTASAAITSAYEPAYAIAREELPAAPASGDPDALAAAVRAAELLKPSR